jgi:hypothetical protein
MVYYRLEILKCRLKMVIQNLIQDYQKDESLKKKWKKPIGEFDEFTLAVE